MTIAVHIANLNRPVIPTDKGNLTIHGRIYRGISQINSRLPTYIVKISSAMRPVNPAGFSIISSYVC